jgi:cell division septum initiation protein DivIVA
MEITARELRDLEIAEAFRGYNRDVVNDLLERAAATIEAANERMREMQDRLDNVQAEAGRGRETEDILHRTLLLAQRAADEAVAEAQEKSRQMIEESELRARKMVADAESESRRRSESERRRLEEEVLDLAGRRDALLTDVEAMTRFETDYRDRMVRALEADLAALRTRPSAAPGPKPETHEVEIPIMSPADVAAHNAPPAPTTAPASMTAPPSAQSTAAPPASAAPDKNTDDSQSTRAVDVAAMIAQSTTAPPASSSPQPMPPAASPQNDNAPSSSTRDTPAATAPPAPASPPGPASSASIDLLGDDSLEAEVLDDDAFFATLREAVHDETPLGPREDDDERMTFFEDENDDDRASFRDVFRRRR